MKKKAMLVVVVVALIAAFKFAEAAQNHEEAGENVASPQAEVSMGPSPSATATPRPTGVGEVATPVPTASQYKDGTYSATGSYNTPETTESIGVTLTILDDKITAASVRTMARDPKSKMYQGMFAGGYTSMVVGKNIASLELDRVSGSSLTPNGFNAAVAQIRAQAKV